MKLDFGRCPKCRCNNFKVEDIILPKKKDKLMRMEFNLYYAKTCMNCGYTEFYSAKIVDGEVKKEKIDGKVKTEGNI